MSRHHAVFYLNLFGEYFWFALLALIPFMLSLLGLILVLTSDSPPPEAAEQELQRMEKRSDPPPDRLRAPSPPRK